MDVTDDGGSRVAEPRKERDVTQVALARRTRVSLSLLSKIEVGARTLTPAVAARRHVAEKATVIQAALRTLVNRWASLPPTP